MNERVKQGGTALAEAQVTVLHPGPDPRMEGTAPDRCLTWIGRAELWSWPLPQARAQALILAGGGYTRLMLDKEGVEVAEWLAGAGIEPHLLIHRLPGQAAPEGGVWPPDVALSDGMAALEVLNGPGRPPLLLMGLSSGGHLAGALACRKVTPPLRGALITYAPLNANHRAHKVPEGKPDYAPVEKQDFYDAWPVGLEGHPGALPLCPLFLAYALNDAQVPVEHALRVARTAAAEGLDVDLHVFGRAPHGFALRDRAGSHALWTDLAEDWIGRHITG